MQSIEVAIRTIKKMVRVLIIIIIIIMIYWLCRIHVRLHYKRNRQENVTVDHHIRDHQPNVTTINVTLPPAKLIITEEDPKGHDGLKKILYWNDLYRHSSFGFGTGQQPFVRAKCRVNTCYATTNRTKFNLTEIDALLWNLGSRDRSLPSLKSRSPHTVYVIFSLEAPHYSQENFGKYNGVFNWTFSYRFDSDLHIPYGRVKPLDENSRKSIDRSIHKNYAHGKTKLVSWLVSHCGTFGGRETFVKTLQKYVPVDVYGACGPLSCKDFRICNKMVYPEYKFYLSFENRVCMDYITEKLFRSLRFPVIPVVYGKGYEHHGFPPNSYIDVFDFESIEHVASYLQYLDKNDTAYNEYFRWRSDYEMPQTKVHKERAMCTLCERLHEMYPGRSGQDSDKGVKNIKHSKEYDPSAENVPYHRIYHDMQKWWVEDSKCYIIQKNKQFDAFMHGISKTDMRRKHLSGQEGVPAIIDRPNKMWTEPATNI